jgi:hypothetical protein
VAHLTVARLDGQRFVDIGHWPDDDQQVVQASFELLRSGDRISGWRVVTTREGDRLGQVLVETTWLVWRGGELVQRSRKTERRSER